MLRAMNALRARQQPLQKDVAEFAADVLCGPRRTIGQQHRANSPEDRERREARVGRPEHSCAYAFLDQGGVENVSALAPVLDQTVARLRLARLFGRNEAQEIATLVIELDRDVDRMAQARGDILAGIHLGLVALADGLQSVAQDAEVERLLGREIEVQRRSEEHT